MLEAQDRLDWETALAGLLWLAGFEIEFRRLYRA